MSWIKDNLSSYSNLKKILEAQLEISPAHEGFFKKRFSNVAAKQLEDIDSSASQIMQIAGKDLKTCLADYDWVCALMRDEEVNFLRTKKYRLTTFQQALDQVYSNDALMSRYMNGLMLTQLWWSNHTECFSFYCDSFLKKNTEGYSHLEIGPGHGLLLAQAAKDSRCGILSAWDVSPQSIASTKQALASMNIERHVDYQIQDIFATENHPGRYDSIVLSEVLEHLEHPAEAIGALSKLLAPDGRLYINMPVNSPAPDHLFLLRSPEAVLEFVEAQGMKVESSHFAPQTNYSLEKARKMQCTISVALIAVNP